MPNAKRIVCARKFHNFRPMRGRSRHPAFRWQMWGSSELHVFEYVS